MKIINPSRSTFSNLSGALRHAQSVYKALTGGLELATPMGTDSSGIYNQFTQANHNGVMIRIYAHGTPNQSLTWPLAANTPLVINHGLLKQPLGFHITDIDAAAKVYRVSGATLDMNNISLATDTPSVNATVFIF